MEQSTDTTNQHSISYNIFILVLTVVSLIVMVMLVLPLSPATRTLLTFYDNAICIIFLIDFSLNMWRARSKRAYFLHGGGWLDLLGSIPSFGFLQLSALLRLFRLGRLARIMRLMRGKDRITMVEDILSNRAQYALFLTILATIVVLTSASVVVLQAESRSPDANITTGGDALWWSFVTITTVGYGDYFPVTTIGRTAAVCVMIMGIGIIGALASILASLLVGGGSSSPSEEEEPSTDQPATNQPSLQEELSAVRSELAALRQLVQRLDKSVRSPE